MPVESPANPSCLRDPWILGAFGLALLLRGGLVAWFPDPTPVNDEIDYWRLAEGLARGEGFGSNFRPPLHPAFMSFFVELGPGAVAVRAVQALLGALSVFAIAWLAERLSGRVAARVAGFGFALDPVLIGFSHLLWSETLYIALLLGGIAALVFDARRVRPAHWAVGGLCFGLAALARPQLLTFLPLLLPWAWLVARRRGTAQLRPAAIAFVALTCSTCAVVLPWSLRNARQTGAFFLVDTNGPYNVLVGTEPGAHRVDKDDRWSPAWAAIGNLHYMVAAERDPGAAQRLALRRAGRRIAEAPGRFVRKSLWEAVHLFTLDNFVLRHLRNDWYGVASSPSLTALLTVWCVLWTALLYAGGSAGLILQPASPLRGIALMALLHAVVLFGLTYSLSRYAVPLRPFFLLGCAWLVTSRQAALERLRCDHQAAGLCVATAAWLLLAWARDLPLLVDLLATGGAGFPFVRGMAP
ncbi:MAG: glycosyltransferase family 39 protein [Deltaproteobacteria bacterium]|nr:glycosyltransferase family 39 protein [Deltaproteobacteria bacterium]MBW2361155.1 glycosyltransferase family 39 protein [Deltaproteobacteria bacterium]